MDIPIGTKVRYPDLVGSPSRATLAVPPSGSGLRFPSLPSGACTDYPLQSKLDVTFSGFLPILPLWRGKSWKCHEAKCDNKLEYNLLGFGGLGIFVVSTLLILHAIGIYGVFATPTSWELMKCWKKISFLTLNFASSAQRSITKFSETSPPLKGSAIWAVCLDPLFDYVLKYGIRLLRTLDCRIIWDILEAGFLWIRFPCQ